MKTESYEGCTIKSTPNNITDEGNYKYAVNGIIQVDSGSHTIHIMTQRLNVPANEWKHVSEDGADETFIKYAKIYIEHNLT